MSCTKDGCDDCPNGTVSNGVCTACEESFGSGARRAGQEHASVKLVLLARTNRIECAFHEAAVMVLPAPNAIRQRVLYVQLEMQ